MKIIKKIFFIFLIFNLFASPSSAKDPAEFISEVTQSASDILKENISVEKAQAYSNRRKYSGH